MSSNARAARASRLGYALLLSSRILGLLLPLPALAFVVFELGAWWLPLLAFIAFALFTWRLTFLWWPARFVAHDVRAGTLTFDLPIGRRVVPVDRISLFTIMPVEIPGVRRVGIHTTLTPPLSRGFEVYVPDDDLDRLTPAIPSRTPMQRWGGIPRF